MWFILLAGVIAFFGGVLFLFSPKFLQQFGNKINTTINKMSVSIDEKAYKMRLGMGVSLLLVSGMLLFVAYYLAKKYTL